MPVTGIPIRKIIKPKFIPNGKQSQKRRDTTVLFLVGFWNKDGSGIQVYLTLSIPIRYYNLLGMTVNGPIIDMIRSAKWNSKKKLPLTSKNRG